jgi:hypothetical protein
LNSVKTFDPEWAAVKPAVREIVELIPGVYHAWPTGEVVGRCVVEQLLAQLLFDERNKNNRHVITGNVGFLNRVLLGGLWDCNGETIIWDWDGFLRNGQHRIKSCAETGVPLETWMIFGINPEFFRSYDQGVKRGMAHVLDIGKEANASNLAAVLANVQRFKETGNLASHNLVRTSNTEYQLLFEKHPLTRESTSWVKSTGVFSVLNKRTGKMKLVTFPSTGMTGALHYLFGCVDKKLRDQLFTGMVEIEKGHIFDGVSDDRWSGPRYWVTYIRNQRTEIERDPAYYTACWIKCWNYFCSGKKIKEVRWRRDGGEPYPQIWGWTYNDKGIPVCANNVAL